MTGIVRLGNRIAILALLLACCGCGKSTYRVQGKVTFEGQPLQGGGSISFVPMGSEPGKTAAGEIGPDGSYQLMTNRPGDGSMPGEFRVVIVQVTVKEPERSADGTAAAKVTETVAPKDRIPAIYSDHRKSPLITTVQKVSVNEIDFDLKRQPGTK